MNRHGMTVFTDFRAWSSTGGMSGSWQQRCVKHNSFEEREDSDRMMVGASLGRCPIFLFMWMKKGDTFKKIGTRYWLRRKPEKRSLTGRHGI
jgi:hypothetical protein